MSAGRPSPPGQTRPHGTRRPVLSARAGAALGVVVVLIIILALPGQEWLRQGTRLAQLEAEVAWYTERVAQLEDAQERWEDPAYVEAQARSRLHFVRPGEVGYVVLTDEAATALVPSATQPMAQAPTGGPWWAAVWATVESAAGPAEDVPPAAPAPAEPAETYGG